ncbi:MAG: PIG-L deacetylase family protein [bacterium]
MKTLIIAAHPDDEVLGCGGTIAKLAAQGEEVHILILATGLTSRVGFDFHKDADSLKTHERRAHQAASLLGAKNVTLAGFPDQKMDTLPLLEITQRIEAEIDLIKPRTIFTHHGGDLNMDHVITYRATLTATRPIAGGVVRSVYAYEVPSSTEWAFQKFEPRFQPNLFFDVNETLNTKIAAMQVYESETREFPHPRSPQALRAIAERWGSVVGVRAAEAFELVREIIR